MTRSVAIAFAIGRLAFAAGLLAAPQRTARPWLGDVVDRGGATVATRAVGVRDGALATGLLVAARTEAPLRPWLVPAVASDLVDIAATVAARDSLPDQAVPGTVALAGAAALIGGALALVSEA